jgi:hypothetical protein
MPRHRGEFRHSCSNCWAAARTSVRMDAIIREPHLLNLTTSMALRRYSFNHVGVISAIKLLYDHDSRAWVARIRRPCEARKHAVLHTPPARIHMEVSIMRRTNSASDPGPSIDPNSLDEPECECQDAERCPVHHGYD